MGKSFTLKDFVSKYAYRVIWSEEDKKFVGLCTEFPSCSWLASSHEEALKGIKKIIRDILKDMEKNNEPIPKPLALKEFSGKMVVRMPPEVHRKLAMEAQEKGVSINMLINSKLG
jgi:predicted HicB family RNase H-like nuclease